MRSRKSRRYEGLVRNLPAFARFLDSVPFSNGELVNFTNIAAECGVDSKTVAEYYRILVDTLLGTFLEPFRKRRKRQVITSTPKFYLFDVGVAGGLAKRFTDDGKNVLLVAGDTFRAAAVEQLEEWGRRLAVEVVAQGAGADAAAVAFDGVARAVAKGFDVVLIDTAGRLHTKAGLMEELGKLVRVTGKALPGAPHEKLIVLDATVGGNGLAQAREFHAAVGLTGAVVAKLDGTARGGVVLAIAGELGIPITHVGVGEGMEDLRPFDAQEFVHAILPEG